MAGKEAHIRYWIDSAEDSWHSAGALIDAGRYMMALFCWHLCVEKLLKVHWVKDNESNFPPRTHNLLYLHKQTKLDFPEELLEGMRMMDFWQLEGRYPEFEAEVYKTATKNYVEEKRGIVEKIRTCLLEKLQ